LEVIFRTNVNTSCDLFDC